MFRSVDDLDQSLRQAVLAAISDPFVTTPWHCDVLSAHAELIGLHTDYARELGHGVEPKFAAVKSKPQRLEQLLWDDYTFLCKGIKWLDGYSECYTLGEIAGASPYAQFIDLSEENTLHFVILFRGVLLRFVHSSFSKLNTLLYSDKHADCIPQHDSLLEGDDYSDSSLVAGIFGDIEMYFDKGLSTTQITPRHLASPYNYCERVEGARRFLLGREIVRPWYSKMVNDEFIKSSNNLFDSLGLADQTSPRWMEELWCDSLGLMAIINAYSEAELSGPLLYELENAIIGVIQLLTLLDLVDCALLQPDASRPSRPPALIRRDVVRQLIKSHPNYQSSPQLQEVLPQMWGLLNAFRRCASGAGTLGGNVLSDQRNLHNRLNEFGKQSHLNMMHHLSERSGCPPFSAWSQW
jgi:hypothetical protein